jgi:hypothetical protein
MIIFVLAATFLIGIAALAIEGGVAQGDRRFLRATTDGAALAAAEHLNVAATPQQQQEARQAAVLYVRSGLTGGNTSPSLPPGCTGAATDFGSAGHAPGSAVCDPDSAHSLYVQTPYNSHNEQVLVQLNHFNHGSLSQVVGINGIGVASRSVAKQSSGGQPFPFALYIDTELNLHGLVAINIGGNVFVGGCITGTNNSTVTAEPQGSQIGSIEVFYGDIAPNTPAFVPVTRTKQIWDAGAGVMEHCKAQVYTAPFGGQPASFGAAGHRPDQADFTCGQSAAPAHFPGANAACPLSPAEPPVARPGIPDFHKSDRDPYNCPNQASRATFPAGSGQTVEPGCYNGCASGAGGNLVIGSGDTFLPGTYAFFPQTTGCSIEFQGSASTSAPSVGLVPCHPEVGFVKLPTNTQACGPTDGQSAGGATLLLYNGTGFCAPKNCGGGTSATLQLTAPTNSTYRNFGMLVYDCPPNGIPCGPGGGSIIAKGPNLTLQFQGLIYAPTASCDLEANGGQSTLGQVICASAEIQGGFVSNGQQVTFGGPNLPIPNFLVGLIE